MAVEHRVAAEPNAEHLGDGRDVDQVQQALARVVGGGRGDQARCRRRRSPPAGVRRRAPAGRARGRGGTGSRTRRRPPGRRRPVHVDVITATRRRRRRQRLDPRRAGRRQALKDADPHLGLVARPVRGAHRREVVRGALDAGAGSQPQRVREHGAVGAVVVEHGQHAVQQQPAAGLDEGGEPLLGRAAEHRRAGERERRSGRVQVGGVPTWPRRTGRPSRTSGRRAAAPGPGCRADPCRGTARDRRPRRGGGEAPGGGTRSGSGRARSRAATSSCSSSMSASRCSAPWAARTALTTAGERGAAASLRVDRGREAVPFAGERDPVVAVADRLVQRRVVPAGEQVVADQPVALGHAEPRLELGGLAGWSAGSGPRRSRRCRPRTPATSAAGRRRARRP